MAHPALMGCIVSGERKTAVRQFSASRWIFHKTFLHFFIIHILCFPIWYCQYSTPSILGIFYGISEHFCEYSLTAVADHRHLQWLRRRDKVQRWISNSIFLSYQLHLVQQVGDRFLHLKHFLFHQAGQGERLGEEFPLTVERRMISSSLGEADDWLTRCRNL